MNLIERGFALLKILITSVPKRAFFVTSLLFFTTIAALSSFYIDFLTGSVMAQTSPIPAASECKNDTSKSIDERVKACSMSANERSNFKAQEIIKKAPMGEYTDEKFNLRIEILNVQKIDKGIEVLARAWRDGRPLGFGPDGSVEIERFKIYNPPVLIDDPNGTIIREYVNTLTGEVEQRKLREDPAEAVRQVIAHNIAVIGKNGSNIVKGKVGHTTSTFYPDSDPESTTVDGTVYRRNVTESWATIHDNANGTNADDASTGSFGDALDVRVEAKTSGSTGDWFGVSRAIILFDTSPINSTDNISSATISLYSCQFGEFDSLNANPESNIYAASPASTTALAVGDYDSFSTTTPFSTAKDETAWNGSGAYNNFTLDARQPDTTWNPTKRGR